MADIELLKKPTPVGKKPDLPTVDHDDGAAGAAHMSATQTSRAEVSPQVMQLKSVDFKQLGEKFWEMVEAVDDMDSLADKDTFDEDQIEANKTQDMYQNEKQVETTDAIIDVLHANAVHVMVDLKSTTGAIAAAEKDLAEIHFSNAAIELREQAAERREKIEAGMKAWHYFTKGTKAVAKWIASGDPEAALEVVEEGLTEVLEFSLKKGLLEDLEKDATRNEQAARMSHFAAAQTRLETAKNTCRGLLRVLRDMRSQLSKLRTTRKHGNVHNEELFDQTARKDTMGRLRRYSEYAENASGTCADFLIHWVEPFRKSVESLRSWVATAPYSFGTTDGQVLQELDSRAEDMGQRARANKRKMDKLVERFQNELGEAHEILAK